MSISCVTSRTLLRSDEMSGFSFVLESRFLNYHKKLEFLIERDTQAQFTCKFLLILRRVVAARRTTDIDQSTREAPRGVREQPKMCAIL